MSALFQQTEPSCSDSAALAAGTPEERRAAAASHLAHDARNWLTVLQIYCDLLRSSGAVAGNGRTWVEELSNAVERGQELVTSLLDSAQESTPLQTSPVKTAAAGPKTLDLAAVIQERLPLFRNMAGSAVRVESTCAARAQTTALQEAKFDRILLNLVRNGIDAMPQGGELKIELEVGNASLLRPLVLRVSDSGNGIPADILTRIFESGFTTKPATGDVKSGRGYGLAIVRELTLASGGTVRVHSIVGQGTCFTIELPTQLAPATPQSAVSPSRNLAASSERAKPISDRIRQTNSFGAVRKGTRVPC